ncbi:MAG TPA: ATP-binding cassette domain-containing protein [Burkholderiaceae bacterium]|nr:ATP-binding cassette domain-containing protein [Burkholderiaceae bacterium]
MTVPNTGLAAAAGPVAPVVLAASDVNVNFGALQALQRVSLEVRGNELVGIIGPNGTGKTTFFSVQ